MGYYRRLDHAFEKAPVLPLDRNTKYVFFSDCHRGIGNNNDNFLKNTDIYTAALQYYHQYGYCYIEVGDGDELWENRKQCRINEMHSDIFRLLMKFRDENRLFMLYGNHDMIKKKYSPDFSIHEGLILKHSALNTELRVTHGHQADLLNSVFWRLARFLVRYLWTPLEALGFLDPTSAAKNNTKKSKLEKRYLSYAIRSDCMLITGHTHSPTLGNSLSPYYNCGSCVHPYGVTCIELSNYRISLVKWHASTKKNGHFGNIYRQCPPAYPIYITRELLDEELLTG